MCRMFAPGDSRRTGQMGEGSLPAKPDPRSMHRHAFTKLGERQIGAALCNIAAIGPTSVLPLIPNPGARRHKRTRDMRGRAITWNYAPNLSSMHLGCTRYCRRISFAENRPRLFRMLL